MNEMMLIGGRSFLMALGSQDGNSPMMILQRPGVISLGGMSGINIIVMVSIRQDGIVLLNMRLAPRLLNWV